MYSLVKHFVPKTSSGLKLALTKALSKSIHCSSAVLSSQYYPINDDVFGLTEDQKQVKLEFSICFAKFYTTFIFSSFAKPFLISFKKS